MPRFASLIALLSALLAPLRAAEQTPVNQVFQFMQRGSYSGWADGTTTNTTAYLWIPEKCKRLRGLVIMVQNVPEHRLVGHPAIREVCAANGLGLVWSTPTFWHRSGTLNEPAKVVGFLQQLLDGLAKTSDYEEVATVPWLPMGESMALLMVDALVEGAPDRCIAAIWMKNSHFPPTVRTVPALVTHGTAQEWTQDKEDIRKRWTDVRSYDQVLSQRKANPNWPLSFVIDGHSGHFEVSETLVRYFAHYIDVAAKARLPKNGGTKLRPIALEKGVLAGLPIPGHDAETSEALPWYFDRQSAREAQSFAAINWKAETQLPGFADANSVIARFTHNGISDFTPEMEEDGITFNLRGVMLDKLPDNFVGAGEPLAKAPGAPALEWLCGPVTPIGGGKFRVVLDRTYPQCPVYYAARQRGTHAIRDSVQPVSIQLKPNTEGKPQIITFAPIPDVKAGTPSITLVAQSDSGLPVGFFVEAGPAIVQNDRLVFTGIPPRARFPVEVTVATWQWGRAADPKVQKAEIVRHSFHIIK